MQKMILSTRAIILLLALICLTSACTPLKIEAEFPSSSSITDVEQVDNQGIPYNTTSKDGDLELVEVLTKLDSSHHFLMKWTLVDHEPKQQYDEVHTNLKVYSADGSLISGWSTRAKSNMSDNQFYFAPETELPINQIERYSLEWYGIAADNAVSDSHETEKQATGSLIDDLGIPYTLEHSDPALRLTRLVISADDGFLTIQGELLPLEEISAVDEAVVTGRFYGEMGQERGAFGTVTHKSQESDMLIFNIDTGINVEEIERYSIQWMLTDN